LDIKQEIREFVINNFLFGASERNFGDDDSFMETGVIDSTGVLELVALLLLIGRRVGGLESRRTLIAFVKSGLASLAMGAALIGWQAALSDVGALALGGGGILLGAAVYVGAALLLRVEELHSVIKWALRRPAEAMAQSRPNRPR